MIGCLPLWISTPSVRAATIYEITEDDFLAVMSATHKLADAVKKALNPDGINLLQLNGRAANQVVPHLHMHIVPRWSGDGLTISQWDMVAGDMENIKAVAEKIQGEIAS